MNMWKILDIEKTKDSSSIERAYTTLRVTVPVQEAKMLSAAYEFALRLAKIKNSPDSFKEEMLIEMSFSRYWKLAAAKASQDQACDAADLAGSAASAHLQGTVLPQTTVYNDFLGQMQRICDDFFTRRDAANWQNLLHKDSFWSTNKIGLEPFIQDFLLKNRNIPSDIWNMFDNEYEWTTKIDGLIESNQPFARCLLSETCPRWKLDYSFASKSASFDYDNYFKYRKFTREAALENDLERVKEFFDKAIDLYTNDPVLYEIVAVFYSTQTPFYKYGKYGPEFLHALNKLIKIHYDDSRFIRERAEYYTSCEYFDEARDDYDLAMKLNPEDLKIPYMIAETFRMQSLSGDAKSYLKYIKKIYQKTQSGLEKQMSTTDDRDKVSAVIDSNDAVLGLVFDRLK